MPVCYPGDTIYTGIVQDIYHSVTADNIVLSGPNQPRGAITRQQLCSILTNHHNNGIISPEQSLTNKEFLDEVIVGQSSCANALIYTQGYDSISGWQQWAGYHSGNWYSSNNGVSSDHALWSSPSYKPGKVYVLQPVRFDSQYRIDNCVTVDSTGATCRNGWYQSGQGVKKIFLVKHIESCYVRLILKNYMKEEH